MTKQEIPESAILSSCIKWLWLHGCFVWRNNTGRHKHIYKRKNGSVGCSWVAYGLPGSADIIGTTPSGKFLAVETKRAGKKLEPHQEKFKEQVLAHNGIFILAHSIDDLEAAKGVLV